MSSNPREGKVVVIGSADIVAMYRTLGCLGEVQRDPAEALRLVDVYANRSDVSLILIEKDLGQMIERDVEKIRRRTGKIIFMLPSPRTEFAPSNMREEVLKALGFG